MKLIKPARLMGRPGPALHPITSPPPLNERVAEAAGALPPPAPRRGGYTVIELIGVLAIMAVLASMLVPTVLNNLDSAWVSAETSSLNTIQNQLEFQITHQFQIPSETNWVSFLASSLMVPAGTVATNSRGFSRVYVYDTTGFGGLTLPYVQTNGMASVPGDPRLMIISSVSTNVPINSGGMSSNLFTTIWNTAPGTIPSSWTNWNGNPGDLIIQRVNLQPLFCRVVLNAIDTNDFGSVTIQSGTNTTPYYICICTNNALGAALTPLWNVTGSLLTTLGNLTPSSMAGGVTVGLQGPQAFTGWYIQGTVINLYDTNTSPLSPNLESQAIIQGDCSYVFEDEAWRGLLSGWGTNGPGTLNLIIGAVGTAAATAVAQTCTATEKVFKGCPLDNNDYYGGTHGDSCTAMSGCFHTFMADYSSWCDEGFGTGSDNSCQRLFNDYNAVYNITQNMCQ